MRWDIVTVVIASTSSAKAYAFSYAFDYAFAYNVNADTFAQCSIQHPSLIPMLPTSAAGEHGSVYGEMHTFYTSQRQFLTVSATLPSIGDDMIVVGVVVKICLDKKNLEYCYCLHLPPFYLPLGRVLVTLCFSHFFNILIPV
jgi:hypothetical protein